MSVERSSSQDIRESGHAAQTGGDPPPAFAASHAAQLSKALHLLLHDLRAPLAVAQGSLRLIRQGDSIPAPDRDRAFECTVEALGRMSRVCADASSFVESFDSPAPGGGTPVSANLVAERLVLALRPRVTASLGPVARNGAVRLLSVDRLVDAVITIVTAAMGSVPAPHRQAEVEATSGELRVLAGTEAERRLLRTDARRSFDPWRGGHGLSLPCACRAIELRGGHVWGVEEARGAVALALPLEV